MTTEATMWADVNKLGAADVKVGQDWFAPPESGKGRTRWRVAQIDFKTMTLTMVAEHTAVPERVEVGSLLAQWSPAWRQ